MASRKQPPKSGSARRRKGRKSLRRKRSASFDVGYGKPPLHSQFRKGKSGNPKGRPRGSKGLRGLLRDALWEDIGARNGGKPRKISVLKAIIQAQVDQALAGSDRAALTVIKLADQLDALREQDTADEALPPAQQELVNEVLRAISQDRNTGECDDDNNNE